ncbi:hypothetical protein [Gordonia sp. MP11Mi]|uniref:Uncharacterized protein n=1 Tax=Gordonia sp. MP11Mi TaxID=3022769 RepID=A0AA97CXT5_9ACTN
MSAPWARERAAWLMHRSRPGTSARRRAEILARSARQGSRASTGVDAAPMQDELTPPMWRRVGTGEEAGTGRKVVLLLGATTAALAVGPGCALGAGLYRGRVALVSKFGRLRWQFWAGTATAALAVLMLAGVPFGVRLRFDRHFPVNMLDYGPWWAWVLWQTAIALGVVGYLARAWGWPGVAKPERSGSTQQADGTWAVTVDEAKARELDPYAGAEAEPADRPSDVLPDRNPALAGDPYDGITLDNFNDNNEEN